MKSEKRIKGRLSAIIIFSKTVSEYQRGYVRALQWVLSSPRNSNRVVLWKDQKGSKLVDGIPKVKERK